MGINVDCKPLHFAQFAVMGATYVRFRHGKERPRVGLLSNGTEPTKGTELTRAAHRAFESAASVDFEYCGYVEANQVFLDHVDVIVTDGFTGNVLLKVVEGTVGAFTVFMKQGIARSRVSKVGALMMKSAFSEVRGRIDPDNYGGAPLLGIKQIAVICHGGASPVALANGLRQADDFVRQGLTPGLTEAIQRNSNLFEAARGD
jgi:glycerol-3-phosphate acyltransferase PlsX